MNMNMLIYTLSVPVGLRRSYFKGNCLTNVKHKITAFLVHKCKITLGFN